MTSPPLKCTYCGGLLTDQPGLRRPCTAWWLAVCERLEDVTHDSYENIEVLGHGGMGAVFKATHRVFRYTQALKALAPDPEALHGTVPDLVYPSEVLIKRFKTEATVMHRMSHENIVRVHEIAAKRHIHYFSMDYVDGPTLEAVIAKSHQVGLLGLDLVRVVLRDVGAALDYAHRQTPPVIHRDIKPSNVLIHPDGKALVTDFGIASVAEATAQLTGSFVGTVRYMSPEAWKGQGATPAADQYSFGVLAYELITGRHPFAGMGGSGDTLGSGPPAPITDSRGDCPKDLQRAVLRMLAKRPEERWASVSEALDAMGVLDFPQIQAAREALARVGGPDTLGPETATRLEIALNGRPEFRPGESLVLSATIVKQTGEQASRSQPGFVGWSSSDPDVAEVDEKGRVTARSPGSATIRARSVGFNAEVAVTVLDPPTLTMGIRGLPATLVPGEEAPLTVEVIGLGADASTMVISWTSTDPEVATVSNSGIVTAKRPGTARVVARAAGLTAEARIEVLRAPVQRIELGDPGRLVAGRTYGLRATAYDAQGQPVPDAAFRWSCSDRKAEIDPAGTLRARQAGTTRITVGTDDASASLEVEIGEPQVSRIVIEGWAGRQCRVGRTLAAKATKLDELGAPISGPVRWSSSEPSVAAIDDEGRLRFLAKGTAEITATDGAVTDSRSVEVSEPRRLSPSVRRALWLGAGAAGVVAVWLGGLTGRPLEVRPTQVLLPQGDSVQVRATVRWWGLIPIATKATFHHRGTGAVQLAGSGLLKATGAGADPLAVDTFEVVRGSDTVRIEARVRIEPGPVLVAVVTIGSDSLPIGVGESRSAGLVAAADSLGRPAGQQVQWTSRDPRIAEVDGSGTVRGRAAGRTVVLAQLEGVVDSVAVVVRAAAELRITFEIVGANSPLQVGGSRTLTVSGRNAAGGSVPAGRVGWSSRNPSIAAVNAAGTVVGNAVGQTVIVARVGDQETTTNVVIEAKEPPPCVAGQLSRMVARPADTTLRPNETVRVSVDGLDTCGKPMSVTGGRWVVSPPDIVAVDGRQARALGRAGAATATLEVGDIRTTIRIAVEGPRGPSDGDRRGVIADRDACADEVGASNIGRVTDNSDRQWLAGVIRTGRRLRFTVLDRGDPVFVGMDNAESAFALQLRFTDAFGGNETWRVAFAVKHTRAGAGWTATCQITSRQKT